MRKSLQTRYSGKTDAELDYIVKDAGEAARAMRGLDDKAEGKYLDQMNEACTEIYRRRRRRQGTLKVPLRPRMPSGDER